ncbi:hypothetical protein KY386_02085 [Candidatus Parcubacteria bacterium]|nr:hypothetical protein [Candidatus Parcubacteria bacterium]
MNEEHQKAELAWQLSDYVARQLEPPERLQALPLACEGELMTDDEIDGYCRDAVATLMILRDKGSPRAQSVHAAFVADLGFLLSIGRLSLDDYNNLINDATFEL